MDLLCFDSVSLCDGYANLPGLDTNALTRIRLQWHRERADAGRQSEEPAWAASKACAKRAMVRSLMRAGGVARSRWPSAVRAANLRCGLWCEVQAAAKALAIGWAQGQANRPNLKFWQLMGKKYSEAIEEVKSKSHSVAQLIVDCACQEHVW